MKKQAYNPFLPSWEYIPDGEPRVFEGRVYVYGSHDRFDGDRYCLNDYVCWSASVEDLGNWVFEGEIYKHTHDSLYQGGLRLMFAPDVVKGFDGRYYLYYTLDISGVTSVAVCDTPAGKYEFYGHVKYTDGVLVGQREGDVFQFDPGVLMDGDKAYLYSGFGCIPGTKYEAMAKLKTLDGAYCYELSHDMLTVSGAGKRIVPAAIAEDVGGFKGHEFYEASSPRRFGDLYYFVYSSRLSHELCYAVSRYPDRDFEFGGTIISNGDIGYNGITEKNALNYTGNIHGGLAKIGENYYIFYHRHSHRRSCCRQACAEQIHITDGKINQVEITSCGLNNKSLIGKGRYPAYIACNLYSKDGAGCLDEGDYSAHPFITQTGGDREDGEEQYVANITDGTVIGFKYFDLTQTTKISLEVRGDGIGKFIVYGNNKSILTEIKVDGIGSFSGAIDNKVRLSDKNAVLLVFVGEGSKDLISIALE